MAGICQLRRALVEIPAPQPKIAGMCESFIYFSCKISATLVLLCRRRHFATMLTLSQARELTVNKINCDKYLQRGELIRFDCVIFVFNRLDFITDTVVNSIVGPIITNHRAKCELNECFLRSTHEEVLSGNTERSFGSISTPTGENGCEHEACGVM